MVRPARSAGTRGHDETLEHARTASYSGNMLATTISAVALLFSAYSVYESVLRAPELAIYVPPRLDYTDPDRPDNPFEVFVVPITVANDGARTGTVLSIDLEVTNPKTGETKTFYADRRGAWRSQPVEPFAPVSLSGRASFSDAVQFFPRAGESVARILDLEPGKYRFKLSLQTAVPETGLFGILGKPGPVRPLEFEMQIGQIDYRNFSGAGTMAMWAADYKPATTANGAQGQDGN